MWSNNKEGLRDRNSPICTLSQNGYGDCKAVPREERGQIGALDWWNKEDDGASRCGNSAKIFSKVFLK